jgi:hypothetical protein
VCRWPHPKAIYISTSLGSYTYVAGGKALTARQQKRRLRHILHKKAKKMTSRYLGGKWQAMKDLVEQRMAQMQ